MNICTKFHGNPSNRHVTLKAKIHHVKPVDLCTKCNLINLSKCSDISVWAIDRLTNNNAIPTFTMLAWLKISTGGLIS